MFAANSGKNSGMTPPKQSEGDGSGGRNGSARRSANDKVDGGKGNSGQPNGKSN